MRMGTLPRTATRRRTSIMTERYRDRRGTIAGERTRTLAVVLRLIQS